MRLTCPNCGAQYEVPDDVIPQDGRDVQCSNCGTTWFQPHASANADEPDAPDPAELRDTLSDLGEDPEPAPDTELPEQTPAAAPPERRSLDPEVQDILQQEAALEARLRSEDSGGLETQPDLGLDDTTDDAERRAQEARARMDRLKGPQAEPSIEEAVATATAAAATQTSRRDRLPDIDEINSSLRRSDVAGTAQDTARPEIEDLRPKKSGFARGFAIPLLIIAVLVLVYANAPRIADAVPALGSALNSYVLMVDQLRVWLDAQISSFLP